MYEGWHIEFSRHVRRRMDERHVSEQDVLKALAEPDSVSVDRRHGGKLLRKYLPEWDRIVTVAVEERDRESMVLVKTVLWSPAN